MPPHILKHLVLAVGLSFSLGHRAQLRGLGKLGAELRIMDTSEAVEHVIVDAYRERLVLITLELSDEIMDLALCVPEHEAQRQPHPSVLEGWDETEDAVHFRGLTTKRDNGETKVLDLHLLSYVLDVCLEGISFVPH